MKLVLASSSPRRKHLLSWMGLPFIVREHQLDEASFKVKNPPALVGQLAMAKAQPLAGELVIGSDLVVSLGETIYGKPKDQKEAFQMLKNLSGKTHTVYCGIAVANKDKVVMSVAKSQVKMKAYDDQVIDRYIKEFEVLDKGGAYAIQFELAGYGRLVESFKGGITTITGLPLDYLENLLKEFDVKPKQNWRKICKIETGYEY